MVGADDQLNEACANYIIYRVFGHQTSALRHTERSCIIDYNHVCQTSL